MPKTKDELVRALFNSSEFGGFSRVDQLEALGIVDSELGSLSEESLSQFGQHYNPQYKIPSAQPILESLESEQKGPVELRRGPTFLESARTSLMEAPRFAGEVMGGELPSLLPGGLAARPFVKPTVGVIGAAVGGAAGEALSEFNKSLPVGVRGAAAGFSTGLGPPAALAGAALDIAATLTSPDGQFEPQPESPDVVSAAIEGAVGEAFGRTFGIPKAIAKRFFPTANITQVGKLSKELDIPVPPVLGSSGLLPETLQNVADVSFISRRSMNKVTKEAGEELARLTSREIDNIYAEAIPESAAGTIFRESLRTAERTFAKEAQDIYEVVLPKLDVMTAKVDIKPMKDFLEEQLGVGAQDTLKRVLLRTPEAGIVKPSLITDVELPDFIPFREARLLNSNIAADIRNNTMRSAAGFREGVIKGSLDEQMEAAASRAGMDDTYKAFDNARTIWRNKSEIYDRTVVGDILKKKGKLRHPEFIGDVIWKPRNVSLVAEVKEGLKKLGPIEAAEAWSKIRRRGFETAVEKMVGGANPNRALAGWWHALGREMQDHLGGKGVGQIRNIMQLMRELPPTAKPGGLQAFEKGSLVAMASGGLGFGGVGLMAAGATAVPIVVGKLLTTKSGLRIMTEGLSMDAFRRSGLFTKVVARTAKEAEEITKFTTKLALFGQRVIEEEESLQSREVPKPPSGPVKLSKEDLELAGVPNER